MATGSYMTSTYSRSQSLLRPPGWCTSQFEKHCIKIYTDGSGLSDRTGSGIYIEKRKEWSFYHRNPDSSSVLKCELIAIENGLEVVLNKQDFGDLWILSDSRSSLQHLYNWITIPSHVNIFENEQGDLLAKEDCNASPLISSTLTYSEHQSRVKSEALKKWRIPPNHHWHESKYPGSSFLLKCGRVSQTTISRLKSDHIKSLSFGGGMKSFAFCTKCKNQQASPDHILDCLGLSREDPFSSPLWILDFLTANGLLGLVSVRQIED
ncbi:RNase H domain-containing protein [Trichonephila clavipes]|nr:RNase H domain-containing protein [Trichonephila clavipes]